MDIQLKKKIVNDYPYPITVEFMRLNTPEYKCMDKQRLDKIIDVTESIIHFLSLIALSDLVENNIENKITVPIEFKKRFRENFVQPTFGKWNELLRETIKIFKAQNVPMFITELADLNVKGKNSETEIQEAFNKIINIRNRLNHPQTNYSKNDLNDYCVEADKLIEMILESIDFLMKYQFLYVNKVTVKYHRWADPVYDIDMSRIIGSNPELFDSLMGGHNNKYLLHTPAIIVTKESTREYLNLEPFFIYSDEGEMKIPDIFMYIGCEKDKRNIKYKPIWKGGSFDLFNSSLNSNLLREYLRIFEILASEEDYNSLKNAFVKTNNDT